MAVFTSGELAIAMRDACAAVVVFRAGDVDLDQLAGALAVAHHLQREIEQHRVQLLAEIGEALVGGLGDSRVGAALAGREQQQRVAGRGVAIDRDGVEAGLHALGQQLLQHRRRQVPHR